MPLAECLPKHSWRHGHLNVESSTAWPPRPHRSAQPLERTDGWPHLPLDHVNRLADRTSWGHSLFKANAGYGIVLVAVLLLVAYVDGRQHADLAVVASSVWAAAAALVALAVGQIIEAAVDRARALTQRAG